MSACHVSVGVCGGQRKLSDPLKLEVLAVVSCPACPMEEQQVLVISEPCLQPPHSTYFYKMWQCAHN